jgi:hypothetical protein
MGVGVGRKPGASCWVSLGFAAVERKGLLRTADVADRRVQEADTRPCLDFFFAPLWFFHVFTQDFCKC